MRTLQVWLDCPSLAITIYLVQSMHPQKVYPTLNGPVVLLIVDLEIVFIGRQEGEANLHVVFGQ